MFTAQYHLNRPTDADHRYCACNGEFKDLVHNLVLVGIIPDDACAMADDYMTKMTMCQENGTFGGNSGIPGYVHFLEGAEGESGRVIMTFKNDRPESFPDDVHMDREVVAICWDKRGADDEDRERFWFIKGALREVMEFPELAYTHYWFAHARDLKAEQAEICELRAKLEELESKNRFGR